MKNLCLNLLENFNAIALRVSTKVIVNQDDFCKKYVIPDLMESPSRSQEILSQSLFELDSVFKTTVTEHNTVKLTISIKQKQKYRIYQNLTAPIKFTRYQNILN